MSYTLQAIANIASSCAKKNIQKAVLSPGSRVAPLALAFAQHPKFTAYTISDERSAGFIAMGMAQQDNQPVVVACTSGTAALNYGPAIAEAFYQQIPLIVITADRPPEWVDQQDGQTIRQERLHQNHVKASYQLPVDYEHPDAVWHIERTISEAINEATTYPKGPVHINAPFREPFYPMTPLLFDEDVQVIQEIEAKQSLSEANWQQLLNVWEAQQRILIVAGQERKNDALIEVLRQLKVPIISDVIANLHDLPETIKHQDGFLGANLSETTCQVLQPDLLITFGKSVISKNAKLFLRKYKPKQHWHLQEAGKVADTFQSLQTIIRIKPTDFLRELAKRLTKKVPNNYLQKWQVIDKEVEKFHQRYFADYPTSELAVVNQLMKRLPNTTTLHLANSMSVRYANLINLYEKKEVEVFANRGTSGIDGSNSTAVGHALANQQLHVLLTGDLSFLYDRNAFWHKYPLANMRVILLNNHGGVIFRMIDGPRRQKELDDYFVTKQASTAKHLAAEFGFEYQTIEGTSELTDSLSWLFSDGAALKLLEIKTDSQESQESYLAYKAALKALF